MSGDDVKKTVFEKLDTVKKKSKRTVRWGDGGRKTSSYPTGWGFFKNQGYQKMYKDCILTQDRPEGHICEPSSDIQYYTLLG